MTNDELLSKTISYLRFPLTVGVVFIHFNIATKPLSVHGIKYGLDNPDWYYYFISFFSNVLPRIGVPLFFIISGFLFFYHKDFTVTTYKQKLKTRARTLLIPFLLWNIIAILILASCLLSPASTIEIHFSPARIFHTLFANFRNEGIFIFPDTDEIVGEVRMPYPIDVPLWYVRDLMVMTLLTPAVYWLIRRAGKWFVIALGVVWYFYQALFMPEGGWSVLLSRAAFFFSWGAYYSINGQNFVLTMSKLRYLPWLYIPVAIADTLTKGTDYNIFIHEAGILIGIVSVVLITSHLLKSGKVKVNDTLANCSFFVFALHTLIMRRLGKLLLTVLHLPDNTYTMLTFYIVLPILTIAICVAIYMLLKRYAPSVCNVLTGGR